MFLISACNIGEMLVTDMHVDPDSSDFQNVRQAPIGMVVEFVHGITDVIIRKLPVAQAVAFIPIKTLQVSTVVSSKAGVSRQ